MSIYGYPEHLNPFYEEENHKRLRFWKMGSFKNLSSRRGSLNFQDTLKQFFPLKSFRKKKSSSTLGINKTSESPTFIRRDQIPNLNASNNFNIHYNNRSSLQDVNRLDFSNRRNNFRQTLPLHYGSTSSFPRKTFATSSMTPGSSINSVCTNPFETDNESEVESSNGRVFVKKYRKKRKAPPPPVPLRSDSNSQSNSFNDIEVKLTEITRLTEEFESFLSNSLNSPDIDNDKSPNNIQQAFENESESRESEKLIEAKVDERKLESSKKDEINHEEIKMVQVKSEETKLNQQSFDVKVDQNKPVILRVEEKSPSRELPIPVVELNELRIVEPELESVPSTFVTPPKTQKDPEVTKTSFLYNGKLSTKGYSRELTPIPNSKTENLSYEIISPTNGENSQRRRSVKDIIESINKSQQLLRINQVEDDSIERKNYY